MTLRPPSRRTERTVHGGMSAWVKYACHSKIRFWHRLQKLASHMIALPLLRPTVSPGGEAALAYEATKLREFRHRGFMVPTILAETADQVVLSDIGPSLRAHLLREKNPEARLQVLEVAARTLAELHNSGLCHGRPHVKDMVYDQAAKRIGFLDLEENPASVMPLATAQERDFWLFLCACGRYIRDNRTDVERIAHAYLSTRNGSHRMPESLIHLANLLRPICKLTEKYLYNIVSQDIRNVVIVNKVIENASSTSGS